MVLSHGRIGQTRKALDPPVSWKAHAGRQRQAQVLSPGNGHTVYDDFRLAGRRIRLSRNAGIHPRHAAHFRQAMRGAPFGVKEGCDCESRFLLRRMVMLPRFEVLDSGRPVPDLDQRTSARPRVEPGRGASCLFAWRDGADLLQAGDLPHLDRAMDVWSEGTDVMVDGAQGRPLRYQARSAAVVGGGNADLEDRAADRELEDVDGVARCTVRITLRLPCLSGRGVLLTAGQQVLA